MNTILKIISGDLLDLLLKQSVSLQNQNKNPNNIIATLIAS